uniref:hypothetical protein n=1 Tax=Collinsella sp. TaxID=1965294 RepID=UPI003FEDC7C8
MKTDRYGISGSTLKIIAAISMVLDHVSRIVLTNGIMTHASYNQISDEQWAILSEASDVLSPRPFRHHLYCESAPPP